MKTATLVLVTLLTGLLLQGFLASADAAEAGLRAEDVHRELGYITLDDGVRLAYVLYLPPTKGPFPTLFTYNPYLGGGQPLEPQITSFLRHDYAVLSVSIRGTGCSEGVYPLLTDQGKDGAQVVEWAAKQRWSTGAVGMFGNSYPGTIQFFVAAHRPKHLKALAASGTTDDGYSEMAYPGGIMNTYLAWWTYFAQPAVKDVGVKLRVDMGDSDCSGERGQRGALLNFDVLKQHPFFDDLWEFAVTETAASQISIPVFITHGWQDEQIPARGAIRLFEALKGPKRIILSNGGHGFRPWKSADEDTESLRWFDRWLKGKKNGVDKEPPVSVWFETQFATDGPYATPAWVEKFKGWPIPKTNYTDFYLNGKKGLRRTPPTAEDETKDLTYFYPYSSEIINTNEMFSTPPHPSGAVMYRTEPMDEDTAIIGTPVLKLYMSCEEVDTDIMVMLHDVDPEGNVLYLQRGFMRASHRKIDPTRSLPHDPAFAHDKEELLTPGEVYEITIPLYPIGHVVRKGHRLELGIMTPPTLGLPTWGFVIKSLPGVNTIHHSSEYRSVLELPVIPGLTAKAPAPPFGSLRLQPSRKAQAPSLLGGS